MKSEVEILITGDFCPIGRTGKAILEGKSDDIIAGIKSHIEEADISVTNLETPLSLAGKPIEKTGPNLKADPGCVEFLVKSGFSLINTANNHIYDFGEEAFSETMKTLENNNLRSVGSGMNLKEAVKESIYEVNGKKIAFIAYAENEYTVATKDTAGAAPVDFAANARQIREVSASNDITVVMVHGGNEYNPVPSPGMVKRYRGYIDSGALAVVAMHTHCPQGYEFYKGCPVIYSLGNFLFDTPYPDRKKYKEDDFWWKGYMVKLIFGDDVRIETVPIDFGPDGTKINEITGDKKSKFDKYLEYISDIIKNETDLQRYWNAWCMQKGPWWVGHFNNVKYPFDRNDKELLLSALAIRNGHTCEAHNEIITTFFKLAAHGNDSGHEEYMNKLEKLQKGIIPEQ